MQATGQGCTVHAMVRVVARRRFEQHLVETERARATAGSGVRAWGAGARAATVAAVAVAVPCARGTGGGIEVADGDRLVTLSMRAIGLMRGLVGIVRVECGDAVAAGMMEGY